MAGVLAHIAWKHVSVFLAITALLLTFFSGMLTSPWKQNDGYIEPVTHGGAYKGAKIDTACEQTLEHLAKINALFSSSLKTNVISLEIIAQALLEITKEEQIDDPEEDSIEQLMDSIIVERIHEAEKEKTGDFEIPKNRKKIRLFIGVLGGLDDSGDLGVDKDSKQSDSRQRREKIRKTWFPNSEQRKKWEKEKGIVIRFVIGNSPDHATQEELKNEEEKYNDIIRLPVDEGYENFPEKTKQLLLEVVTLYDPEWIIKTNDNIYYNVLRTLPMLEQYEKMGVQYSGCLLYGFPGRDANSRNFEPNYILFGQSYTLFAQTSVIVFHKSAIETAIVRNFDTLRLLAHDDTSIGTWMTAFNMTYYQDNRLCTKQCRPETVVKYGSDCVGLCNPIDDMEAVHQNEDCSGPAVDPFPYLPANSPVFDKMQV